MPNQVADRAKNAIRSGHAYKAECDRVLLSRSRNSKPGYTFKADDGSISETSVYATLLALRG